jgi:chromosome segregation ATPase
LEACLYKSKFAVQELKFMQNELKLNITSLQSKIEKLIFMHKKVLEDNLKMQAVVESLQQQISEQNTHIEVLEHQKLELLSNNQVQTSKLKEEHRVSEGQIDEIVRDIDKCIALLSISKKSAELN